MFKRASSLLSAILTGGLGSGGPERRAELIDQFGQNPSTIGDQLYGRRVGKTQDMVDFDMQEHRGDKNSVINVKKSVESIFNERPWTQMPEDYYVTVYGALHQVLLPERRGEDRTDGANDRVTPTQKFEAAKGILDIKAHVNQARVTAYQTHMSCLINEDHLGLKASDIKEIKERLAPLLASQNISVVSRANHLALAFPSTPVDFTISVGEYGADATVLNDLLYEEDREIYRGAFGSDFDLFVRKELEIGNNTLTNCAHSIDDEMLRQYPVECCPPLSFWLSYIARIQREARSELVMTDSMSLKEYALDKENLSTVWTRPTKNPTYPAEDMNGLLQVRNFFRATGLNWEEDLYVNVD